MSDIRARIADALHDNGCHPDDATELADALLSLPGIAVVDLPEAKQDNEFYQIWFTNCGNVLISKDQNQLIFKENSRSADDLRQLAAALLAAANAAEATA